MPDQYGNPTFKDIFDNPEVFKQLYNAYVPATSYSIGGAPSQPATFQSQPAQKVPVPSTQRTSWDAFRQAMQLASAQLADTTRIYQGAPVEGLGARYLSQQQQDQQEREQAAQRAQMFNAQQENQFGGLAQKQAFEATQAAIKQADITARGQAKIDSQTEEAKQNRLAIDERARLDRESKVGLENLRFEHEKILQGMKNKEKETTAIQPKPPTEAAIKEATTINSLADSLDSAEKAFNANVKAHPSRIGQTLSGAGSEFLPKLLGHNVGQSAASSAYPEAQFAEGQLNALSAVIDKLRTGNSRFAIQLYNALRPLVPTVGLSPDNAAKKFQMLRQNLDKVIRTRLRLAPNQVAGYEDILNAVQEDTRIGQRIPTPQPPPTGTKKSAKDVMDDIFR